MSKEELIAKNNKSTYEWIQCLIVALAVCVVIFLFFFRVIDVKGTSMVPTFENFKITTSAGAIPIL